MKKISGTGKRLAGNVFTGILCVWIALASPVTALAEETGAAGNTEAVQSIPMTDRLESGNGETQSGKAESGETEAGKTESGKTEAGKTESGKTESSLAGADPEIPDEDRSAQLGGDTLVVEEYELFRPESSNNSLDTLYKGRSARLAVTIRSSSVQTGDVGAKEILVSKDRDSYRTTGSPVVKIVSKKGENLVFKVIFPKITYHGDDTVFGFQVKYKGTGMESIPLSVDITEAEAYGGSSGTGGSDGNDDGEASAQPILRIERVGSPQPVGAGESTVLTLRLTNTSKSADVEDLLVSFTPGGSMYLMDDTNSQLIKRLNTGKSTEIKVNLQAGQDLSGASQSLDVEMKYNYYSANRLTSGTSTQKVVIPVKGNSASGQPLIQISRVGGGGAVRAGAQFETVIRLENTSQNKDVSGLLVTLEPTEQISLMDATDTRLVGELKAGQTVDIPVRLKAAAELSAAASQLVGISLKFDYDSGKGATQGALTSKVVIPTEGGTTKLASPTPNLIIRSYSYGDTVTAGEVFDLVMEIANTSSTVPVENVLMSLDTGEGISINSSSNTIYIPALAPGATETRTVKVQALFQSKLQSPKIGISFKYEFLDKKERKQSSTTETIAIPVYQPDRLEIKNPSFTDAIREHEETTISIPYANKGRGQIFNVEAKLEGEIDALERELTMGNFESGKSGTIDFVVTPRNKGEFEGKVVLSYEDEAMKRKEITVPVTFMVQEAEADMEEGGESDIPMEKAKLPIWIPGAGILIVAGAVWLTIRRKRNRMAQKLIDDNSFEEWGEGETEESDDEE